MYETGDPRMYATKRGCEFKVLPLARLLQACTAANLLQRVGIASISVPPQQVKFELTSDGYYMNSHYPSRVRSAIRFQWNLTYFTFASRLPELIRVPKTGFPFSYTDAMSVSMNKQTDIFSWMHNGENDILLPMFDDSMTLMTGAVTDAVASSQENDLRDVQLFVAVGASQGLLLSRLLTLQPHSNCIHMDLPSVVERSESDPVEYQR